MASKKSDAIKQDVATVQVFARTGRLPIVSDDVEYLGPGIPPKKKPGIALEFVDGVCTLDPVRDRNTIAAFNEWLEDGTDERIHELGVMVVAKDALLPPFPKWDNATEKACLDAIREQGHDPERCLRYELAKDSPRKSLVKALEKLVDEPVDEGDDPVLD